MSDPIKSTSFSFSVQSEHWKRNVAIQAIIGIIGTLTVALAVVGVPLLVLAAYTYHKNKAAAAPPPPRSIEDMHIAVHEPGSPEDIYWSLRREGIRRQALNNGTPIPVEVLGNVQLEVIGNSLLISNSHVSPAVQNASYKRERLLIGVHPDDYTKASTLLLEHLKTEKTCFPHVKINIPEAELANHPPQTEVPWSTRTVTEGNQFTLFLPFLDMPGTAGEQGLPLEQARAFKEAIAINRLLQKNQIRPPEVYDAKTMKVSEYVSYRLERDDLPTAQHPQDFLTDGERKTLYRDSHFLRYIEEKQKEGR